MHRQVTSIDIGLTETKGAFSDAAHAAGLVEASVDFTTYANV